MLWRALPRSRLHESVRIDLNNSLALWYRSRDGLETGIDPPISLVFVSGFGAGVVFGFVCDH
jgi:hypothetical protein